ncbi:MAG: aldehyde dehydrogenase family protein [Bacillota bacterium]
MSTDAAAPLSVPVLRRGGFHLSLDRCRLDAYDGHPLAEVHQAPPLLVQALVEEMRRDMAGGTEAVLRRLEWLRRAGRLFGRSRLLGLEPEEHQALVVLATGLPLRSVEESFHYLTEALQGMEGAVRRQVPGGEPEAVDRGWSATGRHAWVPLGQVLGFGAPNNHPSVHLTWLLALALGWGVVVRPGSQEPFTAARLWAALMEAGFPPGRLAVAPGPHASLQALTDLADRTVLYGGDDVVRRFAGSPRVLVNGPGRSKVLADLTSPVAELDRLAAFLEETALSDGGRKCTNASAVLVRGEPSQARALAEATAARLAGLEPRPPLDPEARLAIFPSSPQPRLLDRQVDALLGAEAQDLSSPARAGIPRLQEAQGGLFLLPTVVWCRSPRSPLFGKEYPFPFLTFASAEHDPVEELAPSLAVSLLTRDRSLVDRCLRHPGLMKVFHGPIPPSYTEPGAPHQGLLSSFLFANKAFRRAPGF